MLILILIDVQYSQNNDFSFKKGSNEQNHSSLDFHHSLNRVSPSGGGMGGCPPLPKKLACPPTVLTQKCRFCNFHAVFGHFAQIVPPPVDPIWETLLKKIPPAKFPIPPPLTAIWKTL